MPSPHVKSSGDRVKMDFILKLSGYPQRAFTEFWNPDWISHFGIQLSLQSHNRLVVLNRLKN